MVYILYKISEKLGLILNFYVARAISLLFYDDGYTESE